MAYSFLFSAKRFCFSGWGSVGCPSISDIFTCTVCCILGDAGNAGTIPGAIANLVKLTTLELTGTSKYEETYVGGVPTGAFVGGLSGVLPPSIGQLKKLTTFHIEGCSLSGTFALTSSKSIMLD